MEYKAPVESYDGTVREETIGTGNRAITIGGENILPLHFFDEGNNPNPPKFALEVLDTEPAGWPDHLLSHFDGATSDPVSWAKKCQDIGADAVMLRLVSTDPAAQDSPADDAAALAKKVADALDIPLIVYGSGDVDKDAEVLPKVAEACSGMNLLIGPVMKENYEAVGKAILEHGHKASAQSPLDINLLKELNVKLGHFFPPERIVIDPESAALGYGMEYSFSLMERVKQLGVMVKDSMTQMPIIADFATECWKTKQALEDREQGLLWESITGVTLLLAGANLLVMRHPENLELVKKTLEV
ncbi:MAG: acetyl-CoA decarbonylase/synthase complex subunit delta [Chloroflexota bacterium]